MAGYVRQDTSNNIANGSVVDADDLDNEFDAVATAFNTSTGHTHDGSTAEGAPITVVGPAQDVVVGSGSIAPKTDSAYELGTTSLRWSTGYLDDLIVTADTTIGGAVTVADTLAAGSTTITGDITVTGTVDGRDIAADGTKLDGIETGATADQTNAEIKVAYEANADTNAFTDAEKTKLSGVEALADVTDTANVTAAGALMDSEVDADIKTLSLPANTTISAFGATLVEDADASTAKATLGVVIGTDVQAYDANLPAWPSTVDATEVGYLNGVTSAIQTQLNSKAPDNELTQIEVENDTSTVFGQVSGQRLAQAVAANTPIPLHGAVGSYVWATIADSTGAASQFVFGDTYAGSGLYPAGFASFSALSAPQVMVYAESANLGMKDSAVSALSGTWRCMGQTPEFSYDEMPVTLFLRIV